MTNDYPAWICADCGRKHGQQRGQCATYHAGDPCGWCGRDDVLVTEPRDWRYPPFPTSPRSAPIREKEIRDDL